MEMTKWHGERKKKVPCMNNASQVRVVFVRVIFPIKIMFAAPALKEIVWKRSPPYICKVECSVCTPTKPQKRICSVPLKPPQKQKISCGKNSENESCNPSANSLYTYRGGYMDGLTDGGARVKEEITILYPAHLINVTDKQQKKTTPPL